MLVDGLRAYESSGDTINIGRISLVIRTQIEAEISIWGDDMSFHMQIYFEPHVILLNVNCGVKVVILFMH